MRGTAALLLSLLLGSCQRAPVAPPPSPAQQVIGSGYSLRGLWYYPREDYGLAETGLGAVIADSSAGRRTASGETYDPAALTAAHRTLQLPVVLRVTNLETGRSLLVRGNDRGPADPGRVVEVSRRAAELLGMAAGRPAQVWIEVEGELSRALAATVPRAPGEAPALAITTASAGTVQREGLAPLPGARQSAQLREGRGPAVSVAADVAASTAAPPLRLPEQVSSVPVSPGRLLIQLGTFTGNREAQRQAAGIPGARVEPFGPGGRPEWRVRLGPYPDPASADRALEQVLRRGVSEARILVD
ncbi:RlpA-like double-psi beta-barrel domain-containing protein [Roseomonas sp. BN140053]|uniref:septal ring lytic transglycosylase RlpA family protein n=1 Tax=Roseomonas sp. BN140053 TaxID=3391898 RepID=UPI0039E8C95D